MPEAAYHIPEEETLSQPALHALQRKKLAAMLREVLATNAFYRGKLAGVAFDALREPMASLPFTLRSELEADQRDHPPYGANLTYPVDRYTRLHQTSGSTMGKPMRWLDTAQSWKWFQKCWGVIFTAAGVRAGDRLMFPFSFGPFVGFWAAFESAAAMGRLVLAGGGMTSAARIRFLIENEATFVCCTPTYALHLAQAAREAEIDLAGSKVRGVIVAGEPGGSVPEVRGRIERDWGARVFDHTGMTEIGALGFECAEAPGGVHLIESECIAEVVDPATGAPLPDGESGELVLTNLGRWGSPLIRYRTGDQVRLRRGQCACGRSFARMEGGIIGRVDDMIVVRGNNVFPASIDALLRRFEALAEYRVQVYEEGALCQVLIEVEPAQGCDGQALARDVARTLQNTLSFRAEVSAAPPGSLPRFELKAKRFVRQKPDSTLKGP